MTLQTKIYIGLAVALILIVGIIGGTAWPNHKIRRLEATVEETKQIAIQKEQLAAVKELEAAEYKQKIEYLEKQLSGIQITKRNQDEKLEKLNITSRNARGAAERARRTRAIDVDAGELCAKFEELEHPCG
jgi:hypothetical protein